MTPGRHPRPARALLLLAASTLCGCANAPRGPAYLATPEDAAAPANPALARTSLALPSQAILDYEGSAEGTFAADRFEFSRRDAAVSALTRVPLLATSQWPEPGQPAERPVRFTRWQQR